MSTSASKYWWSVPKNEWLTGWMTECNWLIDQESERDRKRSIMKKNVIIDLFLYSAARMCCHFLTKGCETCQHEKPKHVCSVSELFHKEPMTPFCLLYPGSTFSYFWKSVAVFSPCDRKQACTCGQSHMVLSEVTTHHLNHRMSPDLEGCLCSLFIMFDKVYTSFRHKC